MSGFGEGEHHWAARLSSLRTVIRQELIARQLDGFAPESGTVLDVGCGQGTQALRLAQRGCRVTGVDPSPDLLASFAAGADAAATRVELIEGRIEQLEALLGGRLFDLVCAHGVLMYLDDPTSAIAALADRVGPGGHLSITFRNGHALAFRPGLRRGWAEALAAFDSRSYVNELGVRATAHRLDEIAADLAAAGFEIQRWFGVRVLNDGIAAEVQPPADEEMAQLLDAEQEAGRRDPYRWLASQLHVIAHRSEALAPEPAAGRSRREHADPPAGGQARRRPRRRRAGRFD